MTFSPDLENPHNALHVWVGGEMGVVAYAAYDPLFWSHHSFVEYTFCQWQDAHPSAAPPNLDQRARAVQRHPRARITWLPSTATDVQSKTSTCTSRGSR